MSRLLERMPGDEYDIFPHVSSGHLAADATHFPAFHNVQLSGDEIQVFLAPEELIVDDELNAASQGSEATSHLNQISTSPGLFLIFL